MMMKYEPQGAPIDMQYDKWARFENFMKFAEKKELKDRLRELDPPPMQNYVDVETIDNIHKLRRKQGKPPKPSRGDENGNREHVERIAKMKEMYNMFVKMEADQKNTSSTVDLHLPNVPMSPQARNNESMLTREPVNLPEITPQHLSTKLASPYDNKFSN